MSGGNNSTIGGYQIPDVSKIDLSKLKPASGPDFITASNKRGRDIGGQLVFRTGVAWLGGYFVGGIVGVSEGWKSATNSKLRANSVLNGVNKYGGNIGNALGVLALAHTSFVWCADQVDLDTVAHTQYATPIAAGFATGFSYKITSGPRGAVLSGLLGVAASCGVYFAEPYMYRIFSKLKAVW